MVTVSLGGREYTLAPQRIGRIGRKLGAITTALEAYDTDESSIGEVSGSFYEAVKVFIPDLDPEWKLAGYPSAEAYEAWQAHQRLLGDLAPGDEPPPFKDPYDEAADHSPTVPEIMDTISAIFEVNGGQRLVRLLKSVGMAEMVSRLARAEVLRWAQNRSDESLSA